ncbi:hypothetical protein ACWIUD_08150 [Helicobacter sp. 23-1044]
MTQKSREIFADGTRLREKLGIYLQTPQKVEIYAQSAEAMFEKGGRNGLAFVATWSWWGFFLHIFFCAYRKQYAMAVVMLIAGLFLLFIPFLGNAIIALSVKYFIIKDFEKKLDLDNDEALKTGTNMGFAVIIFVGILLIITFARIASGG